jgi:hypothetical protein
LPGWLKPPSTGPGTARRTGRIGSLSALTWAVGRDLVGPVEQLGVDAIAFDQPMDVIPTRLTHLPTRSRKMIAPSRDIRWALSGIGEIVMSINQRIAVAGRSFVADERKQAQHRAYYHQRHYNPPTPNLRVAVETNYSHRSVAAMGSSKSEEAARDDIEYTVFGK